MAPQELFEKIVNRATETIARIPEADLDRTTPCSEWNLRQLLHHMVYELLWVPDLLAGRTIAEVGKKYEGDVLDGDFKEAWHDAAAKAIKAVKAAHLDEIIHLSYGDVASRDYITEVASDILVHTWDVTQSLYVSMPQEAAWAQAVYEYIRPRIEGYRSAGLVAAAVDVSDDAPVLHRLLALLGRDPIAT